MRLVKDDSGERDGYWLGDQFVAASVLKFIQERERKKALKSIRWWWDGSHEHYTRLRLEILGKKGGK